MAINSTADTKVKPFYMFVSGSMQTLKLVICLMNFHDAERKEKGDDKKGAAKRSDTAKDSKTSTKDEDQKDKGEDSTAKKTGEGRYQSSCFH